MQNQYTAIIRALEQRYAESDSILETLEVTRMLGFYYNRVKRIEPTTTVIMQSIMNNERIDPEHEHNGKSAENNRFNNSSNYYFGTNK